jgi:hypothetical protein
MKEQEPVRHGLLFLYFLIALVAIILPLVLIDFGASNVSPTITTVVPTTSCCDVCPVGSLPVCGVGVSSLNTLPILNNTTTSELIGSSIGITGGNTITTKGEVRFEETSGTDYVGFKPPAAIGSSVTWTLPPADGAAGEFLQTNGTGTLSWAAGGLGGNSFPDNLFYIFDDGNMASRIFFQADALIGNSRTFRAPNYDGVLPAVDLTSNNVMLGETTYAFNPLGMENTCIGRNAGVFTTTGSQNTFIGLNAGTFNISGNTNTAVGTQSLVQNTTGNANVSVGHNSLNGNTTGSENVAIGEEALFAPSTASFCTAVGRSALRSNNGQNNVAVGHSALYNNLSGEDNVAVGKNALFSNDTGLRNTAVGTRSLATNQGGQQNCAMGMDSMRLNTSGSFNTALGYQSLLSNTDGVHNIAIGHLAMQQNQSASQNIAIGFLSMGAITALNEDNNVAIGHAAMQSVPIGRQNVGVGAFSLGSFGGSDLQNNVAVGFQALANPGAFPVENVALGDSTLTVPGNPVLAYNTAVGASALNVNQVTGNTAVGYRSMYQNSTGTNCVAVGSNSLRNNTTGTDNTVMGYYTAQQALGSFNTTIGSESFFVATGADRNTTLGASSLRSLTTGNDNIAIGVSALRSLTTANQCVAIGNDALRTSTTPVISNVAVGHRALRDAIAAGGNVAIGEDALLSITSGSNTAVGCRSFYASTNMLGGNCGLGFQSGYSSVTGAYNTFIGEVAGLNNDGSDNVCLGYNCDLPLFADGCIAIGSRAHGGPGPVKITANDQLLIQLGGNDSATDGALRTDLVFNAAGGAVIPAGVDYMTVTLNNGAGATVTRKIPLYV